MQSDVPALFAEQLRVQTELGSQLTGHRDPAQVNSQLLFGPQLQLLSREQIPSHKSLFPWQATEQLPPQPKIQEAPVPQVHVRPSQEASQNVPAPVQSTVQLVPHSKRQPAPFWHLQVR